MTDTTPKNSEWEAAIKACFLTERMTDWPVPTVRVNPDTLLIVVKGLLQERSQDTVGDYERGYMAALDTKYGLGMGRIIKATKTLTIKWFKELIEKEIIKLKHRTYLVEGNYHVIEGIDRGIEALQKLSEQIEQK